MAGPRYRIGIDPGDNYVGLAIAEIAEDGSARPFYLATIQGLTGEHGMTSLYGGRAIHRRARRTRKALRSRLRRIRGILDHAGVPEKEIELVVTLCRHRGWAAAEEKLQVSPEEQSRKQRTEDDGKWTPRVDRTQAVNEICSLIRSNAPGISSDALEKIRAILLKTKKPKVDNRLVRSCVSERCACAIPGRFLRGKTAKGIDYVPLSLSLDILNWLRHPDPRKAFLTALARLGYPVTRDIPRRFRTPSRESREIALAAVKKAWKAALDAASQAAVQLNVGLVKQAERRLQAAEKQIRGEWASTRSRFCPACLHERVKILAKGENPAPGVADSKGHSIIWSAVAAKIASHLKRRVLPKLPKGALIDQVVVERAAFDLVHLRPRRGKGDDRARPEIRDEARWLGPYGELLRLWKCKHPLAKPSRNELLALETGGLCIICGEPLGADIDGTHLIPRGQVGGESYLVLSAAHTGCNQFDGKVVVRPKKEAPLAAMREVRDQIKRLNGGWVHSWRDTKIGIVNFLLNDPQAPATTVERFLGRAFAAKESTMQSAGVIAKAVATAVKDAARGEPEVKARAASEVARARELATSAGDPEDIPWFCKWETKKEGDVSNHAMDAFIVASLPSATVRGVKEGEPIWTIADDDVLRVLCVLRTEHAWQEAVAQALTPGEDEMSLPVWTLTLRRCWRQAYVRDTLKQKDGGYRQPLKNYLAAIKKDSGDSGKVRSRLENLAFRQLRESALAALASHPTGGRDQRFQVVRDAILEKVRATVVGGLSEKAEKNLPPSLAKHPVRANRIGKLKQWALSHEEDIPPWISVSLVKDRRSGWESVALPSTPNGIWGAEQWAYSLGVTAARKAADGWRDFTLYRVEMDGSLEFLRGVGGPIGNEELRRAVLDEKLPPLAPSVPKWRRVAARILREAGFDGAWVFGQGSQFDFDDGTSLVVGRWKHFERTIPRACGKIRSVKNVLTLVP